MVIENQIYRKLGPIVYEAVESIAKSTIEDIEISRILKCLSEKSLPEKIDYVIGIKTNSDLENSEYKEVILWHLKTKITTKIIMMSDYERNSVISSYFKDAKFKSEFSGLLCSLEKVDSKLKLSDEEFMNWYYDEKYNLKCNFPLKGPCVVKYPQIHKHLIAIRVNQLLRASDREFLILYERIRSYHFDELSEIRENNRIRERYKRLKPGITSSLGCVLPIVLFALIILLTVTLI